ncbi:MAG: hypothetical protein JXP34_02630 [Planctomycetes bacterium]|nr:hypothetical protein [Planctomycetota bacterium]
MNETTRRQEGAAGPRWAERFQRLAAANEAARTARLRALTLESALREFEDLCGELHAAFDEPAFVRTHPVGLIKYMRDR